MASTSRTPACRAMLASAALLLAACTRIEVTQADGSVLVSRHLGVLTVEMMSHTAPQLVRARGAGVLLGSLGESAIGFYDSDFAILPLEDCRLVFWVRSDKQLSQITGLDIDAKDLCVIDPDNQKQSYLPREKAQ